MLKFSCAAPGLSVCEELLDKVEHLSSSVVTLLIWLLKELDESQ